MKYASSAVLILLSLLSIAAQGREVSCLEAVPAPWEAAERLTCNVNEVFAELDHEVVITDDPRLHMPNLYISNMSRVELNSDTYVVTIEVANNGGGTATPNRLAILITETNSKTGNVTIREKSLAGFRDLAPGASERFEARFVVPYGSGNLIRAIAIADPASIARPGGDVWESDESDNDKTITFTTQHP